MAFPLTPEETAALPLTPEDKSDFALSTIGPAE